MSETKTMYELLLHFCFFNRGDGGASFLLRLHPLVDAVVALVRQHRLQVPGPNVQDLARLAPTRDVVVGQLELPAALARLNTQTQEGDSNMNSGLMENGGFIDYMLNVQIFLFLLLNQINRAASGEVRWWAKNEKWKFRMTPKKWTFFWQK